MNVSRFFLISVFILLIGCNTKNEEFYTLKQQFKLLKTKNDSLQAIVNEVNKKYIFDSISVQVNPNSKQTNYKIGDNYQADVYIVVYNKKDDFFIQYDTIKKGNRINQKTLNNERGLFQLNKKLDKKENWIFIDIEIDSKYGRKEYGKITDLIIAN